MNRARCSHLVLLLAAVGLIAGPRAAAAPSDSADVVRVSTRHHPSSALRASERPLRSRSEAGPRALGPGEGVHVSLQLDIQPGWHINAHQPTSDALIATSLALRLRGHLDLRDLDRVVLQLAGQGHGMAGVRGDDRAGIDKLVDLAAGHEHV